MPKELIISSTSLEKRLAILEDGQVTEVFIERTKNKGILGNICKGKVTKVLPGMQAAFVDIGLERNAFLYVSDFIEADYEEYERRFDKEEGEADRLIRAGEAPRAPKQAGPRTHPPSVSRRKPPVGQEGTPAIALQRLDSMGTDGLRHRNGTDYVLPSTLQPVNPLSHLITTRQAPSMQRPGSEGVLPARLDPRIRFSPQVIEAIRATHEEDAESAVDAAGEAAARPAAPPLKQARVRSGTRTRTKTAPRSSRRRRPIPRGNARNQIGDLLKEGQEVLVQVSKEPIGRKGARITSHVALPGRYMVFMPTVDHIGVSRRIVSDKERQRLRRVVQQHRSTNGSRGGFIVRTAGENRQEADLVQDIGYLTRLWDDIRSRSDKASAPCLIHSEPGLIERIIRDHVTDDYRMIRIDDEAEYTRIVEFISRFNPALVNRVNLYNKPKPIFEEFAVAPEIEKALKEKVWLKSGGHIVINQTEALVAIDVNTGKFVGSTNSLEDTITRTNLEALQEVVRQIRLRDLGGIIIIDFIDMDERRNRQKVMEALQKELAKDKAPSKILQFNEFGLVAITRKRVRQSLSRTLCQPCTLCEGTGLTKSVSTICYSIHHEVRKMMRTFKKGRQLVVRCHPEVGKALRDGEAQVVKEIEEMTNKTVKIKPDPLKHIEHFDLIESK